VNLVKYFLFQLLMEAVRRTVIPHYIYEAAPSAKLYSSITPQYPRTCTPYRQTYWEMICSFQTSLLRSSGGRDSSDTLHGSCSSMTGSGWATVVDISWRFRASVKSRTHSHAQGGQIYTENIGAICKLKSTKFD